MSKEERQDWLFTRKDVFRLAYDIRRSSNDFLETLARGNATGIIDSQDKFYFQSAYDQINQIKKSLDGLDLNSFKDYVLNQVKMFYILIDEDVANKVFSMMNGAKAYMKIDELVKADFLSKVSSSEIAEKKSETTDSIDRTLDILRRQLKRESAEEWEHNATRSLFAREWDKWVYWWNKEDVKAMFGSGDNPLGLLLPAYCRKKGVSFSSSLDSRSKAMKDFQDAFIKDPLHAKLNFYELRRLQKKFENLYNDTETYNYLGLALSCSGASSQDEIVDYFLDNYNNPNNLKKFALGLLIDRKPNADDYQEHFKDIIANLSNDDVYNSPYKEQAMRMLFMLNVMASNRRKSRFEFFYRDDNGGLQNFYSKRSLEHIWPKSRVVFTENGVNKTVKLNRNDLEEDGEYVTVDDDSLNMYIQRDALKKDFNVTEHCIGNLVFLHRNDNSKFNAKTPEREGEKEGKKQVFFDLNRRVYSRNLIQTIAAFSAGYWSKDKTPERISENKEKTLTLIREQYEQ